MVSCIFAELTQVLCVNTTFRVTQTVFPALVFLNALQLRTQVVD